jgi:hypothetical protein
MNKTKQQNWTNRLARLQSDIDALVKQVPQVFPITKGGNNERMNLRVITPTVASNGNGSHSRQRKDGQARHIYTKAEINKMFKAFDRQETAKSISERLKVPFSTVNYYKHRYNGMKRQASGGQ